MWSKFTNALRPRQAQEGPAQPQVEVLNKVFEQHPNLSVFVPNDSTSNLNSSASANPSPPPSPSKSAKRGMLKRLSKLPPKDDNESAKSLRLTKKARPALQFNTVGSNSQMSLGVDSFDHQQPSSDLQRRASFDMLKSQPDATKPSSNKTRPSLDILRSPSLDMLRTESKPQISPATDELPIPLTPGFNERMGSVRSILRDPKTPGTGQNVRFFSRDAYRVLSPEQSMDTEENPFAPPPPPKDDPPSFINKNSPDGTSTPAVFRNGHTKSHSRSSRPSVSDVFSPLMESDPLPEPPSQDGEQSISLSSPGIGSKSTDLFNISQPLNLPAFHPSALDFDAHSPLFDQSIDLDTSFNTSEDGKAGGSKGQLTSTPLGARDGGKVKERSSNALDATGGEGAGLQVPLPRSDVDDSIFHAADVPPRLPTPLHDRSQSFTMGQTVFFSMGQEESRSSSKSSAAYPSSELKDALILSSSNSSSKRDSLSSASGKGRARAKSDTMLQNMLRSAKPPPEADINDESSDQLVVYALSPAAEPDPFSAHASTYYTPQVMIPVTPPQYSKHHLRKTSKEENLIYSLQTQLSLQNDLCQQYEIDLRARDEMVSALTQKLAEAEKEDNKRRNTLRSWKKKVQELERACRQLEDEVDSSRQMSFERSVMDEASGEALRMLHRQIAALERDKADQLKREEMLKEEVCRLESIAQDRSEDVDHLKEMLWNRDISERELEAGLMEAKEQMDQLGNVSVAVIDEEEMKRLMSQKMQATEDERARHHVVELTWQQEKEELVMKLEGLEVQKAACEEEIEKAKQQLASRDEEFNILKSELEAQWKDTEIMTDKIVSLENERDQIKKTTSELADRVEELTTKLDQNDLERQELEANYAELEQYLDQRDSELRKLEEDHAVHLQERDDRISELQEEIEFNKELASRAQESVRKGEEEINEYSDKILEKEREAESLREQLSNMTREYNRLLDQQSRVDRSMSNQESELKSRIEEVIKQKAEVDVELKTSQDQVVALKDEIDRLRRQVQIMKQASADNDVEINRLKKQHTLDREDLQGLNMALDSKQQELELIKRQMGVRGTAGMTPAKPVTSKSHRRDSSVFTATPISRPPSVASDTAESASAVKAVERKPSSERPSSSASNSRPPSSAALGRSTRINASSGKSSVGSMGPPASITKPRSSIASSVGTPTPKPLGRSSSVKPTSVVSPTGTPIPHRRVSSAIASLEQRATASTTATKPPSKVGRMTSPVPSVPEHDEKENVGEAFGMTTSNTRRRVAVPT